MTQVNADFIASVINAEHHQVNVDFLIHMADIESHQVNVDGLYVVIDWEELVEQPSLTGGMIDMLGGMTG